MKVRLKNSSECDDYYQKVLARTSLIQGNTYQVIEIQKEYYRIDGEDGVGPCLYDKRIFDTVDPSIPEGYIYQFNYEDEEQSHEDDEGFIWRNSVEDYNITPKCFAQRAFFDFYHDGREEQVAIYNEYIRELKDTKLG
jgi:hypothetical protein